MRNKEIIAMYRSGMTLQQVGDAFSITRQRVQQILKSHSVPANKYAAPPEERFWVHVVKSPTCWLWTGYKDQAGYGRFSYNQKSVYAHRFSLALVASLQPQKEIDHLCRNRACINPKHLEQVTHRENLKRSPKHLIHGDFSRKKQTHCMRGHELSGENLRVSNGKRRCRQCHNLLANLRYARRKHLYLA